MTTPPPDRPQPPRVPLGRDGPARRADLDATIEGGARGARPTRPCDRKGDLVAARARDRPRRRPVRPRQVLVHAATADGPKVVDPDYGLTLGEPLSPPPGPR
jgi:hypothetical protein